MPPPIAATTAGLPATARQAPNDEAVESAPHVLHFAGQLTDDVLGFLCSTSDALSGLGVRQTVLSVDDAANEKLNGRMETLRLATTNRSRAWLENTRRLRNLIDRQRFSAIHLHGFRAWLLGGRILGQQTATPRIVYTPHGSRALNDLQIPASILNRAAGINRDHFQPLVLAGTAREAEQLTHLARLETRVIGEAIDPAFLNVSGAESRLPLIVTTGSGYEPERVQSFAQVAVLLSSRNLNLAFNWYGPTGPASWDLLNAANVGVYHPGDAAQLASRLTSAWIYLQPHSGQRFAAGVARAMAVGLPCVVADVDTHREILRHGETGLLYRSDAEMMGYLIELIGDRELRRRLGAAARRCAENQFSLSDFRATLCRAYGLDIREMPHAS